MLGVDASSLKRPRDNGVGVPHLAELKLVAPPNRRRRAADRFDHSSRDFRVGRKDLWAINRLGQVGNFAAGPAANFVPKDSQSAEQIAADATAADHAAKGRPAGWDRRLLDRVSTTVERNDQAGVEERLLGSAADRRRYGFEDPTVQAN